MKKLNEVVDMLKDIFGEEVRVKDNQITGTPIYIEFTEDRVPNLVQLFSGAETRRTKVSDARMTVVLSEPKYGPAMACLSIDDLMGLFGALRDNAVADDDSEDDPEEAPEDPVVAHKIPVEPPEGENPEEVPEPPGDTPEEEPAAVVSETGIPLPVDVPESVQEAMADNISEPEPAEEETDEPEKATNA